MEGSRYLTCTGRCRCRTVASPSFQGGQPPLPPHQGSRHYQQGYLFLFTLHHIPRTGQKYVSLKTGSLPARESSTASVSRATPGTSSKYLGNSLAAAFTSIDGNFQQSQFTRETWTDLIPPGLDWQKKQKD